MKIYEIRDNVFKHAFTIIVGTESEAKKYLSKYFPDDIQSVRFNRQGKFVVFEKDQNDYCYVWIPARPKTYPEFAILQHELLHCLFYGLKSMRGINLSNEDAEEAYTYLFEWMTRETMKKLFGNKLTLKVAS